MEIIRSSGKWFGLRNKKKIYAFLVTGQMEHRIAIAGFQAQISSVLNEYSRDLNKIYKIKQFRNKMKSGNNEFNRSIRMI